MGDVRTGNWDWGLVKTVPPRWIGFNYSLKSILSKTVSNNEDLTQVRKYLPFEVVRKQV